MSNIRPVFWHEGLFLRPQHFQQQDLYHQSLLYQFNAFQNPYFWGAVSYSIQKSRLNNHVFEIDQGTFVFKDGSYVKISENALVESRSFQDFWDAAGGNLSVHIGIKRLSTSEANIAAEGVKQQDHKVLLEKRYTPRSNSEHVNDLYKENYKEELSFLNYNLQIFFGAEAAQAVDFSLIKLAELQRAGSEVKIVQEFVPACISINSSPYLVKLIKDVKEQLTARAKELALYKKDRVSESAEITQRDISYLLASGALNRVVPLLYHYTENSSTSPWTVYSLFRQIIGELSSFSAKYDLFGLAVNMDEDIKSVSYNHESIGKCFHKAITTVTALLDELTAGPDYNADLHFDGTYYYSDLDERVFQGKNEFYLCVRSQLPAEYIVTTLSSVGKLSSRELLPLLIARSLAGVELTYLESPPTALPRRAGTYYFQVSTSGDAWNALREGRNIALYLDSPPADLSAELMVIYG